MRLLLLLCLVAGSKANFLDTIGNALGSAANTVGGGIVDTANKVGDGVVDAANTVGHGVVDAANTVGDGVQSAANAVGSALPDVANTLGSTFGDIWNVVKDPLEETGKELLLDAAKFALEQGVTMALDALAAGKRALPDREQMKTLMSIALMDETKKWMDDTRRQVLGSRDELRKSIRRLRFQDMPAELNTYLSEYATAKTAGKTSQFIVNQAQTAYKNAVTSLKERLTLRVQSILSSLAAGV